MKNNKLNKEEKALLDDFEAKKFKRVKDIKKQKEQYQQHAKATLSKSKTINIRISERDLQRIKALAAEKGLPYQTLISSLLHQYTSRKDKETVF